MASISYRTLNRDLKYAIVNRQLSEDQLRQASENVKASNKKYMKSINICMIICAVIFVVMLVPVLAKNGDPKFIFTMLVTVFGTLGFAYVVFYELMIGMLCNQFNNAVKKAYPDIADEVKV